MQSSTKEMAPEEQEHESLFPDKDIGDKLADPESASKSKKKRKARDNVVRHTIVPLNLII